MADFEKPQSRNEAILQNMLGANNEILEPFSRIEVLLIALLEQISKGGVSPEQIASAVEAYLDEHGVSVTETDPTVSAWAKQPTKPTYTATEVEAVSFASQTLTDGQKSQARANINAASIDDLGTVFDLKGEVATPQNLPSTANRVGDVWYVNSVSAGFIWLESVENPNGYWEELGETVDLSGYMAKPLNPVNGDFVRYRNGAWVAESLSNAESGVF